MTDRNLRAATDGGLGFEESGADTYNAEIDGSNLAAMSAEPDSADDGILVFDSDVPKQATWGDVKDWIRGDIASDGITPRWRKLVATTDYTAAPASTSTFTLARDLRDVIKVGMGVKAMLTDAIEINDGGAQLSAYTNITGLSSANTDNGVLYLSVVDDGGGDFHVDIYKHPDRAAGNLVGHSATYTSGTLGAKAITADNGSGLGGTITVGGTPAADADIEADFMRYLYVSAVTDSLLTLRGPTLGTDAVHELWIGSPEVVSQVDFFVAGPWSDGVADILVTDTRSYFTWRRRRAYLVHFAATQAMAAGTTQGKVNVKVNTQLVSTNDSSNGIQLSTAGSWVENAATAVATDYYDINPGEAVEIRCTAASNATTAALDLTLTAIFVEP